MNTGWCGASLLALACALWLANGPANGSQREKSVVASPFAALRALEGSAAAHPDEPETTRALAMAYLDAGQPGLAVVLLDGASLRVRADTRVQHVHARALIDEGRNREALVVESRVLAACTSPDEAGALDGCDSVLLASAVRRDAILRRLVQLGVDDALAHPEESLVAYQNATLEARVMVQ